MINTGSMKNVKLRKTRGKGTRKYTEKQTRNQIMTMIHNMRPDERMVLINDLKEDQAKDKPEIDSVLTAVLLEAFDK